MRTRKAKGERNDFGAVITVTGLRAAPHHADAQ